MTFALIFCLLSNFPVTRGHLSKIFNDLLAVLKTLKLSLKITIDFQIYMYMHIFKYVHMYIIYISNIQFSYV